MATAENTEGLRRRTYFSTQANKQFKGGEGIEILNKAKNTGNAITGNGYWAATLFAVRGRAVAFWPMVIFTIYVIIVTTSLKQCPSCVNSIEIKNMYNPLKTIGYSLFLLLTFRSNLSYARWWSGRVAWSSIGTALRNMTRSTVGNFRQDKTAPVKVLRWMYAFAISAKLTLRDETDLAELSSIMPQEDLDELQAAYHMPSLCLWRLAEIAGDIVNSNLIPDSFGAVNVLSNLSALEDALTSCERIKNTPMPFAYIVHLRSFLVCYLMLLPFSFIYWLGYWNILLNAFLGYALLGIEAMAVELENPFGRDFNDLPLDRIVDGIYQKLHYALNHVYDKEGIDEVSQQAPQQQL